MSIILNPEGRILTSLFLSITSRYSVMTVTMGRGIGTIRIGERNLRALLPRRKKSQRKRSPDGKRRYKQKSRIMLLSYGRKGWWMLYMGDDNIRLSYLLDIIYKIKGEV
jgi:hypothetical protein